MEREGERRRRARARARGGRSGVEVEETFFSLFFFFSSASQLLPRLPIASSVSFRRPETVVRHRLAQVEQEKKRREAEERERSFRASMKASLLGATESRQKAERRSSIGFFVVSCFVALSLRDEGLVSSSPSPRQVSPGFRAPVSFSTICDR